MSDCGYHQWLCEDKGGIATMQAGEVVTSSNIEKLTLNLTLDNHRSTLSLHQEFRKFIHLSIYQEAWPIMLKILPIMLLCSKLCSRADCFNRVPIMLASQIIQHTPCYIIYASIMPDAYGYLLCFKLCRHNWPGPTVEYIHKTAKL